MTLPRPALLAGLLPVLGCGTTALSGPTEVVALEVAAHRTFCMAWHPTSCLLVRRDGAVVPQFQLEPIEGFTWRWGETAVIVVEVSEVRNPPADGSSRRYRLRKVIGTTPAPAGTEFETDVDMAWPQVTVAGDGSYLLFGSGRFYCGETLDCAAFADAVAGTAALRVRLAHAGVPGAPMRLTGWITCPASGTPRDCPPIP